MANPLPLVVAEHAGRRFRSGSTETDGLKSATATIFPGDRIALVGPSGSGKSTLLHLLGGLDLPTSGRVDWPALGKREELRPGKVCDIFQGPSLLNPLTVLENIRLPLLLMGEDPEDATVSSEAALELFHVAHLRYKLPEEISGGQSQRVAIARALVVQPQLILADEPTGQLDSATAAQTLDTLLTVLAEIGAAIVFSTHDPDAAARFDTLWTMRDGVLMTTTTTLPQCPNVHANGHARVTKPSRHPLATSVQL